MSYIKYVLIAIILTGCGARFHIQRAINKGAQVTTDTTWTTLKSPGVKVKFEPKLLNWRDTVYFTKDSVITKVKIRTDYKDTTIYVETKCPDVKKRIPVQVNTTLSAPHKNKWYMWLSIGLLVGFIIALLRR